MLALCSQPCLHLAYIATRLGHVSTGDLAKTHAACTGARIAKCVLDAAAVLQCCLQLTLPLRMVQIRIGSISGFPLVHERDVHPKGKARFGASPQCASSDIWYLRGFLPQPNIAFEYTFCFCIDLAQTQHAMKWLTQKQVRVNLFQQPLLPHDYYPRCFQPAPVLVQQLASRSCPCKLS